MTAPLKPCLACGRPTIRARCPGCQRASDAQYDRTHQRLRRECLERDNYNCQCAGCPACLTSPLVHTPCVRSATTADHIIPIARGGTKTLTNYQAMCMPCNSSKRDR